RCCSPRTVCCTPSPPRPSRSHPGSSGSASGGSRSSTARPSTTPPGQEPTASSANQTTRASLPGSPASCAVAQSTFFYTDSRVLGGAENAMFMLLESLDRGRWEPTLLLDDAPGV